MSKRSTKLLKAALAAVHYSGAENLLAPYMQRSGVIFMLHRVRPEPPRAFDPNSILQVTPDFLEAAICATREAGFDVVAIDEVRARLEVGSDRPFACFTLDDGYSDNLEYAYPIFKRHQVPFTVYVPTDFADGHADLWWVTLARVLRKSPALTLAMNSEAHSFSLASVAEKEAAYQEIYWWLRSIPEKHARDAVAELAACRGIDPRVSTKGALMTWDDLRTLDQDPLATIGGHTKGHYALAKLSEKEARAQMAGSIKRIEKELGRPCRHFSYPYGSADAAGPREFELAAELGLETAVTTRKGLLHRDHAQALTALPRLSLNGDYQDVRYVKALLSGVPFAILDTLQMLSGSRVPA
jgi:peptidoglycan/xylan/chitin deacetylase (PgdA/CDA1 family)